MTRGILVLAAAAVLVSARVGAGADLRLVDAAERRDTAAVRALLEQHGEVNTPQADGATALHWAAHWNDVATAKRLIAAGARVNAANDYGVTPIALAATNGSVDMIDVLLSAGASPSAALPSGETVLMTAVHSGSLAAVARLLAAGADPNAAQLSKRQTALMWAVADQKLEIAKRLIADGADVHARSTGGTTMLMFAAREGNVELTRLMLASGDDIDARAADGGTPLLIATVRGHARLAMFLLDQGARPDGDAKGAGFTPLHWASSAAESPFVYGGVDAPGEWKAVPGIPDRDAKLALIKSLVAHGANLEARITRPMLAWSFTELRSRVGGTPFFTAAASGDAGVMRLLLALGANPLVRSEDGFTPLMAAAGAMGNNLPNAEHAVRVTEQDRIEALAVALAAGNDLEAADTRGYRAMHVAASAGFNGIVQWLYTRGADLNPRSYPRVENIYGAGDYQYPAQTPLGVAEGYWGGALDIRPQTAEFLKSLGAISEGRLTLDSFLEHARRDKKQATDGSTAPATREERPR